MIILLNIITIEVLEGTVNIEMRHIKNIKSVQNQSVYLQVTHRHTDWHCMTERTNITPISFRQFEPAAGQPTN